MMRAVPYLIYLMLFLPLYAIDDEVKKFLEIAPEQPKFLHDHSYIPQMDNKEGSTAQEIPGTQDNKENSSEESGKASPAEKTKEEVEKISKPLTINIPDFAQILLISFVLVIFVIYRLQLTRKKRLR